MILKVGRRHIHQGEMISLTRHGNLKPFSHGENAVGFAGEHLHSGRMAEDRKGVFVEARTHISQNQINELLKEAKKK